jgi:hypothetical protein
MAGWKVEQAVCTGRGFSPASPNGLLEKFRTWVQKTLVAGGPGWYIHDDRSAQPDPYIVVSSHNAAGPNVPAKYVQVVIPTATSGTVRVYYYIYWDPTLHVGRGLYAAHNLPTLDAADFIYDFRGGPEAMVIQTFTTTVWDLTYIDELTPDPNLLDSVNATTAVANYTHGVTHNIRTLGITAGLASALVDASGKFYASLVNTSGTTWRIDVYNDVAKGAGNLVAQSSTFTGPTAGVSQNVTLNQANSSGLTMFANLIGSLVADATIVWTYNKIEVLPGEGAQFVVGNYYFIYDMTLQCSVNSFNVVSKAGDVLTIDRLYLPFPVGAKIGSYPHPFVAGGSGQSLKSGVCAVPYYNVAGSPSAYSGTGGSEQGFLDWVTLGSAWIGSGEGSPTASGSTDDGYLLRMSPDRRGRYAVQRPGIYEHKSYNRSSNSTADGQTGYGQLKNIIFGVIGTMSPNLHGRNLAGIDYTYFRASGQFMSTTQSWAGMIRETQSNT